MKNRLYALVMATMMLLAVPALRNCGLATGGGPSVVLSAGASPVSELPGDTAIRIPDRNFRAEVRREIGKPEGDITINDVAGITALNVSCLKIADLTGIEYFTALEHLECWENRLTTLDVSQNTKLKTLYCYYNQLKSLDLGNSAALITLHCAENQLTSLDVSGFPALESLECSENRLTTLDLSQNTALEYLECAFNRLTTLDISKNTALKNLGCAGNRLTALDISKNTALEWLECTNNRLKTLDISQNTALKTLWCVGNNFPDQSAIIGLDKDRISDFSFDENDGIDQLGEPAAEAPPISEFFDDTVIWFRDRNFEAAVRKKIGKPEGGVTANDVAGITRLDVSSLFITNLKGIEYFTGLKNLDCASNQLTALDISKNTALEVLNCTKNGLTTLDVSNNTALKRLLCALNQLTELDVRKNTALEYLACARNIFATDKSAIIGLDEGRTELEISFP